MVNVQKTVYDNFVSEQSKIVEELKRRLFDLETKYSIVVADNARLSKRVDELEKSEKSNTNSPKLFSDLFKKNKPENTTETNILNAIRMEQTESEKKSRNVIIFGSNYIEDIGKDKEMVNEISDVIGFDKSKIKFIKRFKRKNDDVESTPILVELSDKVDRNDMLKRSKSLKDNDKFGEIYISPDLTFAERELNKTLVAKRKELNDKNDSKKTGYRYGIRDYKVVKIIVDSQKSV
ncbi:unnamed protein product [Brachionus calyciflorus]|uniref:Endonuclease-reverse transcriptase n=1 Tax=Brachionus calyciflorus TaxID=104777 RepID=A0A813MBX4_9BILA|nr:unnamed protein product [Brachionus calyciflorus]